jgi:hypothetical protein
LKAESHAESLARTTDVNDGVRATDVNDVFVAEAVKTGKMRKKRNPSAQKRPSCKERLYFTNTFFFKHVSFRGSQNLDSGWQGE